MLITWACFQALQAVAALPQRSAELLYSEQNAVAGTVQKAKIVVFGKGQYWYQN